MGGGGGIPFSAVAAIGGGGVNSDVAVPTNAIATTTIVPITKSEPEQAVINIDAAAAEEKTTEAIVAAPLAATVAEQVPFSEAAPVPSTEQQQQHQ